MPSGIGVLLYKLLSYCSWRLDFFLKVSRFSSGKGCVEISKGKNRFSSRRVWLQGISLFFCGRRLLNRDVQLLQFDSETDHIGFFPNFLFFPMFGNITPFIFYELFLSKLFTCFPLSFHNVSHPAKEPVSVALYWVKKCALRSYQKK